MGEDVVRVASRPGLRGFAPEPAAQSQPEALVPSRDVLRGIFFDHCQPGNRGALERYGADAAARAISAILDRDALIDALWTELGDTYDCTRVWSAWGYGTMSEDDFTPARERVAEIADGLIATLLAQVGTRPQGQDGEAGLGRSPSDAVTEGHAPETLPHTTKGI